MKRYKIGFIGAGNMASAIISGILSNNTVDGSEICIFDIDSDKYPGFTEFGVNTALNASDIVSECTYVVLAVKPQNYFELLDEIKCFSTEENVFISIAAGISTKFIRAALSRDAKVVRVMPNTPLLLGYGASAISRGDFVSDYEFEFVCDIFKSSGIVKILDESLMNAVISVNGSSPAYIYLFAKAIVDGAINQGIDYSTALELAVQTLIGSAQMLSKSGDTPLELIKKVSSPGGTTVRALEALENHGFEEAIKDAMYKCTERAEELGK